MIRRDPTRIEFTMEDVEKYKMRVQNASNASSKATPAGKNGLAGGINAANQVADHPRMRNFFRYHFWPTKRNERGQNNQIQSLFLDVSLLYVRI